MKSGRTLWILSGIIVIIIVIACAVLYAANSRQLARQSQLQTSVSNAQINLSKNISQKKTLESETPQLEAQLAEARASLTRTGFPASAESIEYDEILFGIADNCKLRVNSVTASKPADQKESNIEYQTATFTIGVESKVPDPWVQTVDGSQEYIASSVNNVLAFVDTLATSRDFTTVTIKSVSFNVPDPWTATDIIDMLAAADTEREAAVAADNAAAIAAATAADKAAAAAAAAAAAPEDEAAGVAAEKAAADAKKAAADAEKAAAAADRAASGLPTEQFKDQYSKKVSAVIVFEIWIYAGG